MDNFRTSGAAAQWGIPGLINDDDLMQQAAGMVAGTGLEPCKLPSKGFVVQDMPATPTECRCGGRMFKPAIPSVA